MRRLWRLEALVRAEACRDARLFVEEFAEGLDPDATDWDAVAWGASEYSALAEADRLWPVYQRALVIETRRLAAAKVRP